MWDKPPCDVIGVKLVQLRWSLSLLYIEHGWTWMCGQNLKKYYYEPMWIEEWKNMTQINKKEEKMLMMKNLRWKEGGRELFWVWQWIWLILYTDIWVMFNVVLMLCLLEEEIMWSGEKIRKDEYSELLQINCIITQEVLSTVCSLQSWSKP